MKARQTVRYIVDAGMLLALLCLMAYQVTGEALHEWIGIGMTLLLIVHHSLNRKWYGAMCRGKYGAYRILTAFCGMSMSAHAVPFLYGMADTVFARTTHLALSYWSFALMGFHLGLHLPAITAKVKPNKTAKIVCAAAFTAASAAGLWLFIRSGIPDYMLFRTHFAFLDYEKAAAQVFLENIAIESFFAFLGANTVRLIRALHKKRIQKNQVPTSVG